MSLTIRKPVTPLAPPVLFAGPTATVDLLTVQTTDNSAIEALFRGLNSAGAEILRVDGHGKITMTPTTSVTRAVELVMAAGSLTDGIRINGFTNDVPANFNAYGGDSATKGYWINNLPILWWDSSEEQTLAIPDATTMYIKTTAGTSLGEWSKTAGLTLSTPTTTAVGLTINNPTGSTENIIDAQLNGADKFTVSESGTVYVANLLGIKTVPSYTLDVAGSANVDDFLGVGAGSVSVAGQIYVQTAGATTAGIYVKHAATGAASAAMVEANTAVSTWGDTGGGRFFRATHVGTEIFYVGHKGQTVISPISTTAVGLTVNNPTGTTADIQQWQVNGVALSVVDSGGNLGIGTDNPTYPLDVVGNASVSGRLAAGSTATAANTALYAYSNVNADRAIYARHDQGTDANAEILRVNAINAVYGDTGGGNLAVFQRASSDVVTIANTGAITITPDTAVIGLTVIAPTGLSTYGASIKIDGNANTEPAIFDAASNADIKGYAIGGNAVYWQDAIEDSFQAYPAGRTHTFKTTAGLTHGSISAVGGWVMSPTGTTAVSLVANNPTGTTAKIASFQTNSVEQLYIDNNGDIVTSGALTASVVNGTGANYSILGFYMAAGSAASPAFSFTAASNKGMYDAGSNQLGFSTNGTLRLTIANTVMSSDVDLAMQDNEITRPVLTDVGETINDIGSIGGGTQDIDLELGNVVKCTVDTSATTFTFSNWPASGTNGAVTLYLRNGGSQTINWPAAFDWGDSGEPAWTVSGLDIVTVTSNDAGTTILAAALTGYA